MIFGNPYYFGIWVDKVTSWNLSKIGTEGIFAIFINGHMIPEQLPDKSTFLDNSFRSIVDFSKLIDSLENEELFNLPASYRFEFLMDVVHYRNQNLSEEDSFLFWQYCLTDYIDSPSEKDDVWYVAFKNKEKIIYFHRNELHEAEFERGTIKSILMDVIKELEAVLDN